MAVDRAAIANKLAHVEEQVASVRAKEIIVTRVGGRTEQTFGDELGFQERRAALLRWMLDASEAEIRARMALALETAGDGAAEVLAHGNVQGLPAEFIEQIACAELCQLALGEHPSQGGDA